MPSDRFAQDKTAPGPGTRGELRAVRWPGRDPPGRLLGGRPTPASRCCGTRRAGTARRNVFGTHWHGSFESDAFRRAFLAEAARLAGRPGFRVAPDTRFGRARERMLDVLGDLVEEHVDTTALWRLIEDGPSAPPTLSVIMD